MKKQLILSLVLALSCLIGYAAHCPDPENSSLLWGEVPEPWEVSPFSQNRPQGEAGTQFTQANILIAGRGLGVSCTYQNSLGYYTIWQQRNVRIPGSVDYYWHKAPGGYACTQSFTACLFYF